MTIRECACTWDTNVLQPKWRIRWTHSSSSLIKVTLKWNRSKSKERRWDITGLLIETQNWISTADTFSTTLSSSSSIHYSWLSILWSIILCNYPAHCYPPFFAVFGVSCRWIQSSIRDLFQGVYQSRKTRKVTIFGSRSRKSWKVTYFHGEKKFGEYENYLNFIDSMWTVSLFGLIS